MKDGFFCFELKMWENYIKNWGLLSFNGQKPFRQLGLDLSQLDRIPFPKQNHATAAKC